MESSVFLSDLLTAHELGLRKSLDCRQTTCRFMGREHLQKLDVSWDHEGWGEQDACRTPLAGKTS